MTASGLETFRDHLDEAALFLDFDGTLSAIVDRPEEARPIEGVDEILAALSERCRLVAIVSGRAASQLQAWLDADIEIWGVHGAEVARGGRVSLAEAAAAFAGTMTDALHDLKMGIDELGHPGVFLEDKRVAVNVHYRMTDDPKMAESALVPLVEEVALRFDLLVERGRKTLELRPRAEFSKATVVRERTHQSAAGAAAFIGDDIVDLPAFDALDELAAQGLPTLKVAVESAESPDELLRRADVVVDGPGGAVAFLKALI